MGILLMCIGIAIVVIAIVLTAKQDAGWSFLIVALTIPIMLGIYSGSILSNNAIYETEIYDTKYANTQTIYFNEFEQDGNCVVVPSYYAGNAWESFKLQYIDKPLIIKVQNGEFKYRTLREPNNKQVAVESCGE
jgi:hypothetical protein